MILYLVVAGNSFGLTGVVVSMLIAWMAQLFVQLPHLKKFGYKFRFRLNFNDKGVISAAKLALPVLISSWVQPLCVVINMAFGSSLGDGAVSGLNWANKIYIIMVGVFAYAVTNFIFPKLSRLDAGSDSAAFSNTTRASIGWIVCIIAYVSAMFISLNKPVIQVVFERGEFTAENTLLTANALSFYSVGMIGYAVCEILNKSFYAIHDGKTPMYTSVFGVVVNLISAFVCIRVFKMGVGGLALASAISSILMSIVLVVMINKRKKGTFTKYFAVNFAKVIFGGVICGLVAKLIYGMTARLGSCMLLPFVQLCVAAIPALFVYIVTLIILKTEEIKQIRSLIHEK
jgi:putative peptidoglycan lipid II flippase